MTDQSPNHHPQTNIRRNALLVIRNWKLAIEASNECSSYVKKITLESMLLAESVISFERRFSMCSSCVVFTSYLF